MSELNSPENGDINVPNGDITSVFTSEVTDNHLVTTTTEDEQTDEVLASESSIGSSNASDEASCYEDYKKAFKEFMLKNGIRYMSVPSEESEIYKDESVDVKSLSRLIPKEQLLSPPLKFDDEKIEFSEFELEEYDIQVQIVMDLYCSDAAEVELEVPSIPPFILNEDLEICTNKGHQVLLGQGGYGCVFLGYSTMREQFVAVKVFKLEGNDSCNIILEAAMHLGMSRVSDAIPQFHGLTMIKHTKTFHTYVHISEFVGNPAVGSSLGLDAFFRLQKASIINYGFMGITYKQIFQIFYDICKALSELHSAGYIVNDMKMNNTLMQAELSEDNRVCYKPRLIDFGLSTYKYRKVSVTFDDVTGKEFSHVAPETLETGKCFPVSDVYSVGRMLHKVNKAFDLEEIQDIMDVFLNPNVKSRITSSEAMTILAEKLSHCDDDDRPLGDALEMKLSLQLEFDKLHRNS